MIRGRLKGRPGALDKVLKGLLRQEGRLDRLNSPIGLIESTLPLLHDTCLSPPINLQCMCLRES